MQESFNIQEIFGTEDNNLLTGTPESDLIKGLAGNDLILDSGGNDGFFGNKGNDFFIDGAGNDVIIGGKGNDFFFGSAPDSGGNDFIDLGAGNNFALGGEGADTFVLNRNSGVTIITDFTPGEDRLALKGSLTQDDLDFAQLDNNSILNGSTLIRDADTGELLAFVAFVPVEAVANTNFVSAESIFLTGNFPTMGEENNEPIQIELPPGKSGTIFGTPNNDLLVGNKKTNFILASGGNDFVNPGGGKDYVFGEAGNDILNGDRGADVLNGGAGGDVLNGGSGRDTLLGEAGNDILNGDRGADLLRGGSDQDIISGGGGNDLIFGGTGNDALFGDRGRDIFVFAPGEDADIVFDFELGKDKIGLQTGYSYDSLSFEYNADAGYSNITDTQTGELITTLIGVDANQLSATDFTVV